MPIVSVIITTFGEPILLAEAIKSVLIQTMSNFELIIVDDNDENSQFRVKTELIIDFYSRDEPRIKYIKHKKNFNGAVARNTGIRLSEGEFIAFLDSDDEYLPNRLELCCTALGNEQNYKYQGVYTGCEFRRHKKKYSILNNIKSGNFIIETLAGTFAFGTGSNIFIRSNVVKELLFDETFIRHQDYEFLVRYFLKYDLLAIPKILVIKNNDNRNLPSPQNMVLIKEQYLKKFEYIISKYDEKKRNLISSKHFVSLSMLFAKNGHLKETIYYLRRSSKLSKIRFVDRLKIIFLLMKSIYS